MSPLLAAPHPVFVPHARAVHDPAVEEVRPQLAAASGFARAWAEGRALVGTSIRISTGARRVP